MKDPQYNRIDPHQNAQDWKDTEYKKLHSHIMIHLVLNALTLLFMILAGAFFIGAFMGVIS